MATVYVLNKDSNHLMPTTRCGHVRYLLKEKKARVVRANPFTIKLLYETDDVVQPLYLGIDPGRTNIGVAVAKGDGTAVFTAHLETRNKEIPKLMAKRKEYRQGRRHYRRCKRQRRAAAHGTLSKRCKKQDTAQGSNISERAQKIGVFERNLPGCEKPVLCIGIKNKEARFNNRVRPAGWLTPTANQLLLTHISFEMQDPDGIMIGTNRANNSLVTIDMFDTDVHANANAVILGSTGYGKTFTAQLFALRLSEMDTQVFIISPLKGLEDYGGGCKAVGGQFISMDPSSVNSINIMDIRVPDDEDAKKMDDYETTGSLLTKKIHTVKSFLHLVVKDMTQEEEQLIDTSLYKVYGRFGITNDNDSIFDLENGGYKKMPLLEDLQKEMQNVPELHRICNILNPLIRGSMACYNRPTNVDLKAKYIVFDFNGMKGPTLTMSMFVVLDFVWTKIKEDRAKRKAVFIDECWKLIGTDSNEMAAEDVVEIFRTIRAYGGSAFAMTQDISQFYEYKGGKYGKAVIGNADTKIIMHLIPSEAKALQAAIQLTDSEMENVSNLGRGQGLVCSGAAKLFVDFIAAPYEKQEITTDAKSFYLQEKALKEKQHKEEQERLAAEKTNSNTDANDDDADLLNVTF